MDELRMRRRMIGSFSHLLSPQACFLGSFPNPVLPDRGNLTDPLDLFWKDLHFQGFIFDQLQALPAYLLIPKFSLLSRFALSLHRE